MAMLFPLWQVDRNEYDALCAYLGLSPHPRLYDALSQYLANAPFRFQRPDGLARFLAGRRLTRFRIARLDLVTKILFPDHPFRHALNGVMALHECDADGYRQMAASPTGWALAPQMVGWGFGFLLRLAVTVPWLGWKIVQYALVMPFHGKENLAGQRVLITGVSRGLGMDIMLDCLEKGAKVVGTVRNRESLDSVRARLPAEAPVTLLVADLGTSGALVRELKNAQVQPESIDMAVLCAGVKHDGEPVLALPSLRDTFEVNFFSPAELAAWLCTPPKAKTEYRPKCALVLVSSIGRWHGMHSTCGYNASKAALSIWGESLDMELRPSRDRRFTVTIVEPGMFESAMIEQTPLTKLLSVSRRQVAGRIVSAALAGRKSIRPPLWFALVTWGVCLMGRDFRYRLFARAKPGKRP